MTTEANATAKSSKTKVGTRKRSRTEQPNLSRQQIESVALEIIDRKGLGAFSVRDVAQTLGVYHRAIYWHFPGGRSEILGAVAGIAFENVMPRRHKPADWQNWLRELFERYRTSLRAHPNIAPLLGAQLVSNSGVDPALVECVLLALSSAGFKGKKLVHAYNATIASLLGYVTLELAPAPTDDAEWAKLFEDRILEWSGDRFPMIAANRPAMINKSFILRWQSGVDVPLEGGFRFYVEAFLAGLAALAMSEPRRSSRKRNG